MFKLFNLFVLKAENALKEYLEYNLQFSVEKVQTNMPASVGYWLYK